MTQDTAAAERSAHVVREEKVCKVAPCVEVSPGVWKLRAIVEMEARHNARVSELLAANNREVERRREAIAERDEWRRMAMDTAQRLMLAETERDAAMNAAASALTSACAAFIDMGEGFRQRSARDWAARAEDEQHRCEAALALVTQARGDKE